MSALPPVVRPFPVAAPYRTTPAPRPLQGPALVVDDAWPAARRRRLERLRDDPDGVLVRDPADPDDAGLLAALRAAAALLPGPVDAHEPLALARAFLLACSDDLVVLRRAGPGRATTEMLAVAFPSGWSPRERAGADLPALHAPVADGARLRSASAALSEALLTRGPYAQHVWGLDPDGRLDRDPSAPDAAAHGCPPPERWWLRVERQTSVPLPHLDRALFLIRPHLVPLTSLTPAQRCTLHDAVASMSPDALAYKGLTRGARPAAGLAPPVEAGQLRVGSGGNVTAYAIGGPCRRTTCSHSCSGAGEKASPGSRSSTHQAPSATSPSSCSADQPA